MTDVETTEFESFEAEEVHFVKRGANGFPVILAKAAQEEVAAVIAGDPVITEVSAAQKAADEAQARMEANLAAKATMSAADQNDLPDSDFAYIEPGGKKDADGKTTPRSLRHFPIMDAAHVRNALARASQSPFGAKAMPKIKAAAKKFDIDVSAKSVDDKNASNQSGGSIDIPRDPTPEGPAVKDANLPDTGTIPTPGSPAWEAEDAQCASDAANLLLQAAALIRQFYDREGVEVAVGEGNDLFDQYDAQMALQAVTSALGVMARLSFLEGQEAAKSEATFESLHDDMIDAAKERVESGASLILPVEKAGKRLSAQSVAALTASRDHINELLGQDDPAIIPADESAQQEDILDMTKDELIELLDEREAAKAVKEDVVTEVVEKNASNQSGGTWDEGSDEAAKAADDESTEIEAKADPAEAAKSEAATKSEVDAVREAIEKVGETMQSVAETFGGLKDRLETVEKMAAPGGPVKTRTTEQTRKSAERDRLELEAAHYEDLARDTSDRDLQKGYAAKAVEARAAAAVA